MKTYWSKITLSLALVGTCCTLSAGILDKAERWLEGQGINLRDDRNAPAYARSHEAPRRKFDPRARVDHWNEVIRAFKRCGPADNSETMQWAERNLARAQAAERRGSTTREAISRLLPR